MQGVVNILGRSTILWLWSIISITLGWHLRIAIGTIVLSRKSMWKYTCLLLTQNISHITLLNVSISDC